MKKGFTLIELILVIVIGSIVSVFTFSFIYNSIQTYRLMRTQRQLHQEGAYALERITRELRDASYGVNVTGGISFMKAHQTPADMPLQSWVVSDQQVNRHQHINVYYSAQHKRQSM
jgi:prepilin-type N-terminal cleavage/methylation domain-containing protein